MERQNQGLSAITGALLALWNESSQLLRDEWGRTKVRYGDLRDRLKTLEDEIGDGTVLVPGTGTGTTPASHDQAVLLIDLGSNPSQTGAFATSPLIVTPNAVNTTGTGAGSTVQWVNKSAGDLQRIGRHTLRLTPAGTPGTPTPSQAIRLWSVVFPRANFDRTPKVDVAPLSAAAGPVQLSVIPTLAGYDVYAVAGTITAGSPYDFQVTVNAG